MKGKVLRKDETEMRERIIRAVQLVCNGRCELVSIKKSQVSNSLYFTVSNGTAQSFFRVSDHETRQNIKNFVATPNTKMAALERFVLSVINKMKRRALHLLLDSVGEQLAAA